MAIVQFRVADAVKKDATEVYEKLGLDLSSAIRMFLVRSVEVKGIPFSTVLSAEPFKATEAVKIMDEIGEKMKELGLDQMTMDEIDEEIRLARAERKKKS